MKADEAYRKTVEEKIAHIKQSVKELFDTIRNNKRSDDQRVELARKVISNCEGFQLVVPSALVPNIIKELHTISTQYINSNKNTSNHERPLSDFILHRWHELETLKILDAKEDDIEIVDIRQIEIDVFNEVKVEDHLNELIDIIERIVKSNCIDHKSIELRLKQILKTLEVTKKNKNILQANLTSSIIKDFCKELATGYLKQNSYLSPVIEALEKTGDKYDISAQKAKDLLVARFHEKWEKMGLLIPNTEKIKALLGKDETSSEPDDKTT